MILLFSSQCGNGNWLEIGSDVGRGLDVEGKGDKEGIEEEEGKEDEEDKEDEDDIFLKQEFKLKRKIEMDNFFLIIDMSGAKSFQLQHSTP
jgi:hypothetical protein